MANSENLKPIKKGQLTKEEAKRRGSNGGIKSGDVRRARKTLKAELLLLLESGNTQNKISLALIQKALKGDIKAFEVIRDTIGEKPTDKQEIKTDVKPNVKINISEEKIKKIIRDIDGLADE